jgi:hypothetical protein
MTLRPPSGPLRDRDSRLDPRQHKRAGQPLVRTIGLGSLVLALVIGVQLGSIPWRYRRQIWQLQGFALGALVGYVVGRVNRGQQTPS